MTDTSPTFIQDEDGAATPLAIFFCLIFIVMGGLAVDYHKALSEHTQLQIAADSAAHSALYSREFNSTDDATADAMKTINSMLPPVAYGDAILEGDIEYGVWDEDTLQFTVDNSSRTAARVFAQMEPARNNVSRTMLLGMIGMDEFVVRTSATYSTYYPPCFTEGFVAEDVVDLQSGNSYTDGFCIHSNTYVSLNQNNYFEPGTVVSMPSLDNLDIPKSGFQQNEGLQTALRTGKYRQRLLAQLEQVINLMYTGQTTWGDMDYVSMAGITTQAMPIYPMHEVTVGTGNNKVTTMAPTTYADTGNKSFTPDSFPTKNVIYRSDCAGNGTITMQPGTYEDFALVTNCEITFNSSNASGNSVILDGVIIATTSTAEKSFSSSILQLGLDDDCAPGGGVLLMTMGGFEVASDLKGYGAQILAKKNIQFSANANGIEGVSFIAGGTISGTSNSNMGFCDGAGLENFLRAPYFRLVN